MTATRGADLIVEHLVANGIPYAVGLCGHGDIGLLDALRIRSDEIRTLTVHHEQAAGHIADAYFRVTGQPIATFTSSGPGSTNLPVALANAYYDQSAILAITGNIPTEQFGLGAFQETYGLGAARFPDVLRHYVKASFQPTTPEQLRTSLRQSMAALVTGRRGPVHLDVPLDLFSTDVGHSPVAVPVTYDMVAPDREGLHRAQVLIGNARRPILLIGAGLPVGAEDMILKAAEQLNAYVATTPDGKGAVDERLPRVLGTIGRNGSGVANAATREADVIVAVNVHFDDRTSSGWMDGVTFRFSETKLIHSHVDPAELHRNYATDVALVSHPVAFLHSIAQGQPLPAGSTSWDDNIATWRREWAELTSHTPDPDRRPAHPRDVLSGLRGALDDDTILTVDVGVHHNWVVQDWEVRRPGTLLQSWGFGSMGFGVCGVLGVRLAVPDRPAVALCGDGGFLMTAHAVATAVQNDLPAVWVVWDNGGFISIRDLQRSFFDGHEIATTFRDPQGVQLPFDYAHLAESLGGVGVRLTDASDVGDAVRAAIQGERPTVVQVPVDPDISPMITGGWKLPPFDPAMPEVVL